jgi:hypothetical protein
VRAAAVGGANAAISTFCASITLAFAASPSNSIDYAVMEKTDRGVVIPLDAGWNDIGAWDALATLGQADGNGNTQRGDVLSIDTHNSSCFSEGRLLATVGVRDLIVIATPDAVLVADKSKGAGSQGAGRGIEALGPLAKPNSGTSSIAPGAATKAWRMARAIRSNASW